MRSLYGERTLSIAPGLNPVTPTKHIHLRNDSIHASVSRNVRWKNPPKDTNQTMYARIFGYEWPSHALLFLQHTVDFKETIGARLTTLQFR